ncbi:amidohydrolase family protein [Streptomyces sp. CA-249302]|uniref:amidohydrolase family protein n=1 Tax=Streptomyces sp. CA-249302 TaxID=3240058 RepID=UPI003D8F0427
MVSSWILIEHGDVIDGDANPVLKDTPVLVKDNLIAAVGEGADRTGVPRGEPLTVIDATGKTVLPGLIDGHCHMTYGEARTEEEIDLYTSHELRTLIAAWHMKKVLRSGVTSISQPGGSYFIGVGLREAVNRGMIEGPRTISAGRYLSTSNSLTDWYPDSVGVPDGSIGVLTNTADEIKREIRHQIKAGVDLIKLADSPFGEFQAFTDDEMKLAADLAHQHKRRITIHARGAAETAAAADAGFDWIMHGNILDDHAIERLVETGTPLVPTLLLLANFADWGSHCGAPKVARDGSKALLELSADSMHRAHEAGVTFITGTDSGFSVTPYGEWHAREIELLVQYAGLTPLEAIQAATKNAAVTVNLEGWLGEIGVGKIADILVVDGDPLKDLSVLWRHTVDKVVIKDGKVVDTSEEDIDLERFRFRRDRALVHSIGDLRQENVYEGLPSTDNMVSPNFLWTEADSHDIAREIRKQEDGQLSEGNLVGE